MTLQQALRANVRIEPGPKIRTFGGWCRHDRVLLNGEEIGRIQTRRGRSRIEVITVAGNVYTMGYDVEWLVEQGDDAYGLNSTAA
ncbi:MAG TPA: hypothetical protein VIS78_11865 [Blastocatellia bacterium]|jgi:hypothetical protein